MHKGILVRRFSDDVGKISHYQICVPKHLRKKVVYRIQNSPTGGHLGIVRTAKDLDSDSTFQGSQNSSQTTSKYVCHVQP